MKELIAVTAHEGRQAVSARELHRFLGSKQDFSTWIKGRIKKYDFIKNEDYMIAQQNYGTANGGFSVRDEYILTLDTAKELAMVEGNAKGRQARKYFIACEKKLRDVNQNSLVGLQRMAELENRLRRLEVKQQPAMPEITDFTVFDT